MRRTRFFALTSVIFILMLLVLPSAFAADAGSGNQSLGDLIVHFLTHPIVIPILLSVAALGILLEVFTPGMGFPGLIGFGVLALFFYGNWSAGFVGLDTWFFLIIGLTLLLLELIIPFGFIGFLGLLSIVVSVLLAGGDIKSTAIAILIALIVATVGMVIIVKFFGKRLHFFKRVVLTDSTNTESGYVSNVNRYELVGQTAVTATALRPSGTIKLLDERIDAVSDGRFIDAGKDVKIIKVEGSRIVVRELEKEEEE